MRLVLLQANLLNGMNKQTIKLQKEENMKILLVSDPHHFSVYDNFVGYKEAFSKLNISFDVADITEVLKFYSAEFSWGLILSKMLNKDNGYTHVLFVSGLLVPDWILKSKYDKKIGIIGLDDPHASKVLLSKKEYLDYYFSNEKKLSEKYDDIFYLPTATSHVLPSINKNDLPLDYRCDISFVGTVYDDRIKPLEDICKYAEQNNLIIKIVGPLLKTPLNSIIRKYAKEGILNNQETKLLYKGSKVVINLDRNINWNPTEEKGNSTLEDVGEAYSLNPRAYEIAGCKAIQLFINPRKEAIDIFQDNIYVCSEENITKELDKIFKEKEEVLEKKIEKCFDIIRKEHTYVNRAKLMLEYINKRDSEK